MKHHIKTVTWRFSDSSVAYPGIPSAEKLYIRSPEDVFKNFSSLFDGQVRERFLVLWLNSTNRVIGFEIVSEGILNSSLVHPREVFRGAIVATSASVIIAHNHPSGNIEASGEDLQITRQLVEAGKILGIPVYDHIIFGDGSYSSFAERSLL
jgi:DNA repair protein RadC